jgi:hypothetical protein
MQATSPFLLNIQATTLLAETMRERHILAERIRPRPTFRGYKQATPFRLNTQDTPLLAEQAGQAPICLNIQATAP